MTENEKHTFLQKNVDDAMSEKHVPFQHFLPTRVLNQSCGERTEWWWGGGGGFSLSKWIKEELHNRFNLISEERVKIFKHNSDNLMKIGRKIRKLWHFEVSQIFKKHFLTSQYEYANEWGDDVIASQFSIHFVHRNDKNIIFQLWKC